MCIRDSFRGFFAILAATLDGKPAPRDVLPPVKFPTTAVYHPHLPGLVSADLKTYLHWAKATPDKPIIAVLIHQQYIESMQTGFIDDMIARIEAQDATPLGLYAHAL